MKRFAALKNKENRPLVVFYVVVFLIIFVLTSLTPLTSDDFSYFYNFADDTRITSVWQIIPSMAAHREMLNGRVLVHGLVSLILMFPKPVFNVLNALVAVALWRLLSRCLEGGGWKQALSLACGAMALWSFLPAFGENVLWLDGAVNYAWGYTFFLLFLWPYAGRYLGKATGKISVPALLGHAVLAFFAGTYAENASFIFLFLACCLTALIWRKERVFPLRLLPGLAAMLGGWIFLATAPASSHRHIEMGASMLSTVANNLASLIQGTENYLFWLLVIDVLLLIAAIHWKGRKEVLTLSALFIFCALASMLPFAFAAYHLARHYCCCCMLLCFALVLLINELLSLQQRLPVLLLVGTLAVLFLFRFSLGTLDVAATWYQAREREQTIASAILGGEDSVTIQNHVPMTKYALPFRLTDDTPELWPNIVVSSYYRDVYGRMIDIYGKDPQG